MVNDSFLSPQGKGTADYLMSLGDWFLHSDLSFLRPFFVFQWSYLSLFFLSINLTSFLLFSLTYLSSDLSLNLLFYPFTRSTFNDLDLSFNRPYFYPFMGQRVVLEPETVLREDVSYSACPLDKEAYWFSLESLEFLDYITSCFLFNCIFVQLV